MKLAIFLILLTSFPEVVLATKCPAGRHWVNAHHRSAYYKSDGTFVKATYVKAHCRDNPNGYSYWHDKLKDSRPSRWGTKKEIFKKWTAEERERVLEALSEIPEFLWKNYVTVIHRASRSKVKGNPASTTQGIIVLYDNAFNISKRLHLSRILAHELSHMYYKYNTQEIRQALGSVSSWYFSERTNKSHRRQPFFFVEGDSSKSPEEEYSNNLEYFLYEPKYLKSVMPGYYKKIDQYLREREGFKNEK